MIERNLRFLFFLGFMLFIAGCSNNMSTNTESTLPTTTVTTSNTEISTNLPTTELITNKIVQINFFLYEGKDIISIFSEEGTFVNLPKPSRKGYTFLGWQTEEDYDQLGFYLLEIPNHDLYLLAKWEINQYNIRVYDGSNLLVETFLVDYEQILADIDFPDFYVEGYTFVGFYLDENRENLLDYERMPDFDINLYAKNEPNTYNIRYLNYDGEIFYEIGYLFGSGLSSVINPDNPIRLGYSFIGWNIQLPDTMPANDIVLEPIFIINSYIIAFETNGGSYFEPQIYNFNVVINAPTNPIKEGYVFEGWYKDSEFIEKFVFTTMPADNITIYAKWITNFQYLFSYFAENGVYYSGEYGAGYEIDIPGEDNSYEICVEADGSVYLSYIYEDENGIIIMQLSYMYNEFSPFVMVLSIAVQSLYVYGIDDDATYDFDTSEFIFQYDVNTWGVLISEESINELTELCFYQLLLFSLIYFELIIGVPFQ